MYINLLTKNQLRNTITIIWRIKMYIFIDRWSSISNFHQNVILKYKHERVFE